MYHEVKDKAYLLKGALADIPLGPVYCWMTLPSPLSCPLCPTHPFSGPLSVLLVNYQYLFQYHSFYYNPYY